jgi:hypothetical protein
MIRFSANGMGFQNLGSKVAYKIISSLSNLVPKAFGGSNPIHVQGPILQNSETSAEKFSDTILC